MTRDLDGPEEQTRGKVLRGRPSQVWKEWRVPDGPSGPRPTTPQPEYSTQCDPGTYGPQCPHETDERNKGVSVSSSVRRTLHRPPGQAGLGSTRLDTDHCSKGYGGRDWVLESLTSIVRVFESLLKTLKRKDTTRVNPRKIVSDDPNRKRSRLTPIDAVGSPDVLGRRVGVPREQTPTRGPKPVYTGPLVASDTPGPSWSWVLRGLGTHF